MTEHQSDELLQADEATARLAFDRAIAAGILSADENAENTASSYMFMGTLEEGDAFKHIGTREYVYHRAEQSPSLPVRTLGPVKTFNPAAGCKNDGLFWKIIRAEKDDAGANEILASDMNEANARLLAAAYNAFDSAARKLGVNAITLAEAMQDGAFLTEVLDNAEAILYHTPHLDRATFDGATAALPQLKRGAS